MSNLRGPRHGRLAMLSAVLLVSIATPPAFAIERVVTGVSFTLRCAGLMLTDPDEHVAVCNPVMPTRRLDSLVQNSGWETGPAPAPAPPVIVDEEEDEEEEEPACGCGGNCEPPPDDCQALGFVAGQRIAVVAALEFELAEVQNCDDAK